MSKRLHESEKWDDKWFRALKPNEKLVFLFLIDRCDLAGFYEVDLSDMEFRIGLSQEEIKATFQGLDRGCLGAKNYEWIWVKNFIKQQKNLPLNPSNNAHKHIIQKLKDQISRFREVQEFRIFMREYLGADEGLISPIGKDKDKGIGKGIGNGFEKPKLEDVINEFINNGSDQNEASIFYNNYDSVGWLDAQGRKITNWKSKVMYWIKKTIKSNGKSGGVPETIRIIP